MSSGSGKPTQLIDRAELLIDAVDDYAIFMLEPDGTVASWNRGAQRIKGCTAAEIIGLKSTSSTQPTTSPPRSPPASLLQPPRSGATGTKVGESARTHRCWANVLITAIFDADGHLIGYAKVTHDDTERQNAGTLIRQVDLLTERERVSRELQETVVPQIFRAGERLSATANLIEDPRITERIHASIADLDATLKEIRCVITGYRPAPVAPQ